MRKIYYRKLIRDKIPEIIKANGGDFKTRILNNREFEKELRDKLVEEAKETAKAKPKDLLNELSDILELIKTIAQVHKLDFKKIEKTRIKKRRERGEFKKRLFLVWSSKK